MKVIVYGATGMIGQGVVIECLEDDSIEKILVVTRRPLEEKHEKIEELILEDFLDYSGLEEQLAGYDACIYCLGISSAGLSEEKYRRITLDFTIAAGEALLAANPDMRICFVSGMGTDIDGRQIWARVKAEAEQALLDMPWKSAHMFRPAGVMPRKGVVSRTRSYRMFYNVIGVAYPLLKATIPGMVTTSDNMARVMIHVARSGHEKQIFEGADINAVDVA